MLVFNLFSNLISQFFYGNSFPKSFVFLFAVSRILIIFFLRLKNFRELIQNLVKHLRIVLIAKIINGFKLLTISAKLNFDWFRIGHVLNASARSQRWFKVIGIGKVIAVVSVISKMKIWFSFKIQNCNSKLENLI